MTTKKLDVSPLTGLVASYQQKSLVFTCHLEMTWRALEQFGQRFIEAIPRYSIAGSHIDQRSAEFSNHANNDDAHEGYITAPVRLLWNDTSCILPGTR